MLGSKPFEIDKNEGTWGQEGIQRHATASGFVLVEYEPVGTHGDLIRARFRLDLGFSKSCFRAIAMPEARFGGPFLNFNVSKYRFRAIAVHAALFGHPFFDPHFSNCCFRAIAVPAALFGRPFLDLNFSALFSSPYRHLNEVKLSFWGDVGYKWIKHNMFLTNVSLRCNVTYGSVSITPIKV